MNQLQNSKVLPQWTDILNLKIILSHIMLSRIVKMLLNRLKEHKILNPLRMLLLQLWCNCMKFQSWHLVAQECQVQVHLSIQMSQTKIQILVKFYSNWILNLTKNKLPLSSKRVTILYRKLTNLRLKIN